MTHSLRERGTIYTLGYANPDAAAQLERYMQQASTLLVDVRLRPASRWAYHWNKSALASRYGPLYRWEPRLGNLHYQQRGLSPALAPGHEEAIAELAALVLTGTSLVLLCACRNVETCHRMLVAKLLQDALPAVTAAREVQEE